MEKKLKLKISQSTYKSKIFEKFPYEIADIMDEVDEFLDESWKNQQEKALKKRRKGRRR